jgi:hypothetical protein
MKIYPLLLALAVVLLVIYATGCTSRHAVEGKCYKFETGHIVKHTSTVKVEKVQDGYVQYQFCSDSGCYTGQSSAQEYSESTFLDTYNQDVECPIDAMRF